MHEEVDTCRICSAPAEPDQPLYHPCKCSGTIRYIHQDCLTTWLAHSRKKSCDVCKHQYSFTKVYSQNMPKQLPLILFLRRLVQQIFWTFLLGLRGIMVAIIWLAILPYVTVWTWRFYFVLGDHLAWWINDRPRPTPSASSVLPPLWANVTTMTGSNNTSPQAKMTVFDLAISYPVWRALTSDIFTGQIIASFIVLAFLGIFLLREWIVQNARPGVFEDNEALRAEEFEPHVEPEQPQPDPHPVAEPGEDEVPALPAVSFRQTAEEPQASVLNAQLDLEEDFARKNDMWTPKSDEDERFHELHLAKRMKVVRGKNRTHPTLDSIEWSGGKDDHPDSLRNRRRRRFVKDRRHDRDETSQKVLNNRHSRVGSTSSHKGKARANSHTQLDAHTDGTESANSTPLGGVGPAADSFKFTFEFKSPPSPRATQNGVEEHTREPFCFAPPENGPSFNFTTPSALPYPLTSAELPRASTRSLSPSPSSSTSSLSPLRRPPLPVSVATPLTDRPFPDSHPILPGVPTRNIDGNETVPLSPGLATYRAPEELESTPGAATGPGYFDEPEQADDTTLHDVDATMEEYDHYFGDFRDEEDDGDTDVAVVDEDNPPALILDSEDDDDWDGPPIIEADQPPNAAPQARREMQDAQAQAGEEQAPPQDGNEDPDGADDEIDGALEEAIGMRGPVTGVFQNAALMIFALDMTLGLCVFLPFLIGKTSALLSLEPQRIGQIIHFPIRAMRLVTDPVVDLVFLLLRISLLPIVLRTTRILSWIFAFATSTLGFVSEQNSSTSFSRLSTNITIKPFELAQAQWDRVVNIMRSNSALSSESRAFAPLWLLDHPFFVLHAEQFFAKIGKHVRVSSEGLKIAWIDLAMGDAPVNRVFAVALGYTVVGMAVGLYLNVLNVGSVQSAGRAVRNAIRQQLIVVKVATFIVIELVLFPLGCGIMLDLCTLRVFPDTTIRLRLAFAMHAPATTTFYHWMIGTMFMYQFAILLAGCRSIMRPGSMWFIKDPQDQNFHPIRDILERPTIVQLRKLAVSAVMYSVVVACGMGSIVAFLRIWGKTLMPLRWEMREPLSEVPIDLLFLHLVLPATLRHFEPRNIIQTVTTQYWKWVARHLRLTSYMFGGRHAAEERPTQFRWTALFGNDKAIVDDRNVQFDGTLRRVPATDNIALPKDMRATIIVDESGEPVDQAGRDLMQAQDEEAEKAKRNVKDDYQVVYMPPNFRRRIILFIVLLWLVGSSICVAGVALPIHLGRAVFALFMPRQVHDGYSFVVGFYAFWGCFVIGKTLDRLDKRRQRTIADGPRADWFLFLAKRGLLWFGQVSWTVFWMGLVIPTLIAMVMDVYLVIPVRLMLDPATVLRVHVFESWAVGLLYAKMAVGTGRYRQPTAIDTALNQIKRNGWRRPDAATATLDIIVPVTFGLLGMLLFPPAVLWTIGQFLPLPPNNMYLFMYVYPGIFTAAAIARLCQALVNVCASWAQSIRDSEFLVEMRLRNLEPETRGDQKHVESTAQGSAGGGEGMEGVGGAEGAERLEDVEDIDNIAVAQ
ncbi:hypothetical protein BD410DRAFT_786709 [Rickenella mellea]|uniref:RING-type E3 ubiquitin transferase n=1 Tax=Rickenella mellea TaxID=50990 RepID=A0A4Y7Q9N3_9AGAM|nr:hypothetical protein BD410DRAFT_786709 [Rickenella mellea]